MQHPIQTHENKHKRALQKGKPREIQNKILNGKTEIWRTIAGHGTLRGKGKHEIVNELKYELWEWQCEYSNY
jgi:hypothetical protein